MAEFDFSTDDPVSAVALNALARHEAIWSTVAASSSSTGAWAEISSPGEGITFEKRFAGTALRIDMMTALTSSAASTQAQIAVALSYNPTNFNIVSSIYFATGFDAPETVSGIVFLDAVPAGAFSVTPYFVRVSGAGTVTSTAGYPLSLAVREVRG